jgi:hypothetical protein
VSGAGAERPSEPRPPQPNEATNPVRALVSIRQKMERLADEFAQGRLNRAQFNAVYRRYSEQRAIIERLLERDPQSDAWRQVVAPRGQTGFLRAQYQAQTEWFAVYAQGGTRLFYSGTDPRVIASLDGTLGRVWEMPQRPAHGLGRLVLPNGSWMLIATGEYAATAVSFSQEPAVAQARLVRDLHADFERANRESLARRWYEADRMVFPQRALVENH